MGILCIEFIYGSVDSIAGWNRYEMVILICTSQVVNQLYRNIVHWNQNRFIGSVGSGSFDRMLLRPISVVFQANTGGVSLAGLVSALGPLAVLIFRASALDIEIHAGQIVLFIIFVFNGVLVLSSFMLLLYSSSFIFIKVDGITNIYYLVMDIADKPKEIFAKDIMYGFIFFIPAIPLANAPASILLGRADAAMLFAYGAAGILFASLSYLAMRLGLRRYASASS
jgi:ABC-2 type transport system permease protein